MASRSKRIVIIGGIASGPAAAAKAKRIDPTAEVIIYEKGPHVSLGVCELPYLLTGEIPNPDTLIIQTPESLKRDKGVLAFPRHRVEAIFPSRRLIEVRSLGEGISREERYDKLIIASGCRAKTLNEIPTGLDNVFHLKTLSEAIALKTFIHERRPKRVCIVGAGFVGIEAAEAFRIMGLNVDMIFLEERPLPYIDDEGRRIVERILTDNGITLHANQSVLSTTTSGKRLLAVRTSQREIEADVFLIAIGFLPNVEFARAAGIRIGQDGGILTDQRQMTNIDGIYAAGDCTEIRDISTRKTMMMPFASLAYRTARVAGENAAGGSASFKGAVPNSILHVFGYEIAQCGVTVASLKERGFTPVHAHVLAQSRVSFMPGSEPMFVSMTADARSRVILNANIIAKEHAAQRANVAALAIRKHMTIDEFLESDFVYTPRSAPMIDPLHVCARKLQLKSGS